MLLSPRDIELCLQCIASKHRMEVARLSAERAAGDDACAAELTRLIVQAARLGEGLDCEVFRTVLVADALTAEQEVFALVNHGGGRCVSAGGANVSLVSAETPAGRVLRGCRPGDLLPLGQVLAADDSLTARAEARRQAEAASAEHVARCRNAKAEERQRQAAEKQQQAATRDAAKQQEQEAFERRAAAHFARAGDAAGRIKPKPHEEQLQVLF